MSAYGKTIKSVSFGKAWEQAVIYVANSPNLINFGDGLERKYAYDSCCSIILDSNAIKEALQFKVHPSDPFATQVKMHEYLREFSDLYNASKHDYTYYDILKQGFKRFQHLRPGTNINQIDLLRNGLQKQIYEQLPSNRNIAVMYNPIVYSESIKTIPCWNEILIRLQKNTNKVSVYSHFRSHDLFAAWQANNAAILTFINRDIVEPCGCVIDELIESNFSLHIYDYYIDEAKKIKTLQLSPQLWQKQLEYDNGN